MGIHKVVQDSGTLTIVPNAGNVAVTRESVRQERTSQLVLYRTGSRAYGMGRRRAPRRGTRRASGSRWDYAAGSGKRRRLQAKAFEKGGGQVLPTCVAPSRRPISQPLLAQDPQASAVDAGGPPSLPAAAPCSSSRSTPRPASKRRCAARASSPRDARSPGRGRRGRRDRAALRRRARQSQECRLPHGLQGQGRARRRRLCRPGLRCRPAAGAWGSMPSRATSRTRPTSTRPCGPPSSTRPRGPICHVAGAERHAEHLSAPGRRRPKQGDRHCRRELWLTPDTGCKLA